MSAQAPRRRIPSGWLLHTVLWLSLWGGNGCGPRRPPPVSLAPGARVYRGGDYDRVLSRWTRSADLVTFPELETRLLVDATFLSPDFRSAYVARYAADARLVPSAMAQMLAASLAQAGEKHEFYVALSTERLRWGELSRNSSAWRVSLVDDRGREVMPLRIERVRRPSAADREYFPYTTPWRQVFRVQFPRRATVGGVEYDVLGPDTRSFTLRFGGPLGASDLRWDVAPPTR